MKKKGIKRVFSEDHAQKRTSFYARMRAARMALPPREPQNHDPPPPFSHGPFDPKSLQTSTRKGRQQDCIDAGKNKGKKP